MRCRGHGECWRQRRGQEAGTSRPWQRGDREGGQGLRMDTVSGVATGAWVPSRVPRPSIHAEQGFMRQTGMNDTTVACSTTSSSSSTHSPFSPLFSCSRVTLLNLRIN